VLVTEMAVLERKRCKHSKKPLEVNARLFFIHFYVNKKNGKEARLVLEWQRKQKVMLFRGMMNS